MRKLFIKNVALLQILTVLTLPFSTTSVSFAQDSTSAAPSIPTVATPKDTSKPIRDKSCSDICDRYKRDMKKDVESSCPHPTPSGSPSPSPTPSPIFDPKATSLQILVTDGQTSNTYANFEECELAIRAKWGEVAQHCEAYDAILSGADWSMITAVAYTTASVACGTSCALEFAPVAQGYKQVVEAVCFANDMTALGLDVAAEVKITSESGPYIDTWEKILQHGSLGAGGLATLTAGGALAARTIGKSHYGYKGAKEATASMKAGKDSAKKATAAADAAGQEAASHFDNAKKLAGKDIDEAGKALDAGFAAKATQAAEAENAAKATKGVKAAKSGKAASKAAKFLSCATAALTVVTAGMKWANFALHKKTAGEECTAINQLSGMGSGVLIKTGPKTSDSPGLTAAGQGSGSSGLTGFNNTAIGGSGISPDVAARLAQMQGNFPAAIQGAALEGPTGMSKLIDGMNFNGTSDLLNSKGTNMAAIGEKLASGSSPSSVVGDLVPDLPNEMLNEIRNTDRLIQEGKLSAEGMASGTYSGGGGGGGSSAGGNSAHSGGSLFGSRGLAAGGSAATSAVNFERMKALPTYQGDGDIYHSSWNGSIFQLLSVKINQSRNKVEELEWATPLNRALTGLPAVPKSNSQIPNRVRGK